MPAAKNANFAWLQHIIRHLSPNGCAVTLLPNGTLTTQNSAERCRTRNSKKILLDGWVDAILALPAGFFYETEIPCCAWIINKRSACNTVLFVDARQLDILGQQDGKKLSDLLCRYRNGKHPETTKWYAVASMTEIAQKHYVLSPNLYTLPKNSRCLHLLKYLKTSTHWLIYYATRFRHLLSVKTSKNGRQKAPL